MKALTLTFPLGPAHRNVYSIVVGWRFEGSCPLSLAAITFLIVFGGSGDGVEGKDSGLRAGLLWFRAVWAGVGQKGGQDMGGGA